jgi:hypothetical protein
LQRTGITICFDKLRQIEIYGFEPVYDLASETYDAIRVWSMNPKVIDCSIKLDYAKNGLLAAIRKDLRVPDAPETSQ